MTLSKTVNHAGLGSRDGSDMWDEGCKQEQINHVSNLWSSEQNEQKTMRVLCQGMGEIAAT
jgi:hypothetical protein